MLNRTSQTLTAWLLLWDLGLTAAAWMAAFWVRCRSGLIPLRRDVPDVSQYLNVLPLLLVVSAVAYRFAGMYEVHRMRRFREELEAVAKGIGLMAILVMATSFVRQAHHESRG